MQRIICLDYTFIITVNLKTYFGKFVAIGNTTIIKNQQLLFLKPTAK